MGWIGTQRQLLHALRVEGADRDEKGRFLVYGRGVTCFLGVEDLDNDVVVDDAEYVVDGQRLNLAEMLRRTGRGLSGVTVI